MKKMTKIIVVFVLVASASLANKAIANDYDDNWKTPASEEGTQDPGTMPESGMGDDELPPGSASPYDTQSEDPSTPSMDEEIYD